MGQVPVHTVVDWAPRTRRRRDQQTPLRTLLAAVGCTRQAAVELGEGRTFAAVAGKCRTHQLHRCYRILPAGQALVERRRAVVGMSCRVQRVPRTSRLEAVAAGNRRGSRRTGSQEL